MGKLAENTVSVRNVYLMLSYALDAHNVDSFDSIQFEKIDGLYDLFAEILIKGTTLQRKRGFEHDYAEVSELVSSVRGRINVFETHTLRKTGTNLVSCTFDEYNPDTFMNRIIKLALHKASRIKEIQAIRRNQIKGLLPYFDQVSNINPNRINWASIRFSRNNASYRILMNVCYMIIEETGMTQYLGSVQSMGIQVKSMPLLYQHFVLNYYRRHHPQLKAKSEKRITEGIEVNNVLLPELHPDIILTLNERMLVIDTKYYGEILKDNRGKKSISASNRNQILSYVLHTSEGFHGEVSGMLLYAKTDHEPENTVNFSWREIDHDFCCKTLDLNQSFNDICKTLDSIAETLEP